MAKKNANGLDVQAVLPLAQEVGNLLLQTIQAPPKVSEKGNETPQNNPSAAETAKRLQDIFFKEFASAFGPQAFANLLNPEGSLFVDEEKRAENKAKAAEMQAEIELLQQQLKEAKELQKALEEGKDENEWSVEKVLRVGVIAAQMPNNAIVGWSDIPWSTLGLTPPDNVPKRGRKPGSKKPSGEGTQESEI